jgi:hypothetical protein
MDDPLKLLDMTEDEQLAKLPYYIQPKPWKHICSGSFTPSSCDPEYAELAFRLRNEATEPMPLVFDKDNNWYRAVKRVVDKVLEDDSESDILESLGWLANFGRPIHWIIAALIAKQLAKEK